MHIILPNEFGLVDKCEKVLANIQDLNLEQKITSIKISYEANHIFTRKCKLNFLQLDLAFLHHYFTHN